MPDFPKNEGFKMKGSSFYGHGNQKRMGGMPFAELVKKGAQMMQAKKEDSPADMGYHSPAKDLKGGQHKLDKNKDGKLSKTDFDMMNNSPADMGHSPAKDTDKELSKETEAPKEGNNRKGIVSPTAKKSDSLLKKEKEAKQQQVSPTNYASPAKNHHILENGKKPKSRGKKGKLTRITKGINSKENQTNTDYYIGENRSDSTSFYNKYNELKEIGENYKKNQAKKKKA